MKKKFISATCFWQKKFIVEIPSLLRDSTGNMQMRLFAYIYHHLNNCSDYAEDIWQESFLAIFKAIDKYQGKKQPVHMDVRNRETKRWRIFIEKNENRADMVSALDDYSDHELIISQPDFFEGKFIQKI